MKSDLDIKNFLEQNMPKVSRAFLKADFLKLSKKDKNYQDVELIKLTLEKISINKKTLSQNEQYAIRSVDCLIQEIPDQNPEKEQLIKDFQKILSKFWNDK